METVKETPNSVIESTLRERHVLLRAVGEEYRFRIRFYGENVDRDILDEWRRWSDQVDMRIAEVRAITTTLQHSGLHINPEKDLPFTSFL